MGIRFLKGAGGKRTGDIYTSQPINTHVSEEDTNNIKSVDDPKSEVGLGGSAAFTTIIFHRKVKVECNYATNKNHGLANKSFQQHLQI